MKTKAVIAAHLQAGQLARKMVPSADGRTRRGLVAINNMRDRISEAVKSYSKGKAFVHGSRMVIG